MNSRSGDRVPAGVSGQAGRGTVGTVALTTPRLSRLRHGLIQEIDDTHPNAVSRLDRLDGVGRKHRAIVEGEIRGRQMRAACICGWRGEDLKRYGTAENAEGRTVAAREASLEIARAEIAAHLRDVGELAS